MPHLSKTTLVLSLVLAAAVVWAIVHFFFFKDTAATGVSAVGAPESAAEVSFINLATQLDGISFDTGFLSDPRFTGLVDIRNAVIPEASGRKDPFAPVPGVASSK